MSQKLALSVSVIVSLFLSTSISVVMMKPLRGVLSQLCPGTHATNFWMTFTTVMLYVTPPQLAKFGRVLSAKYGRQPEAFEASHRNPHQFGTVLTAADFRATGETFPKSELQDALEYCLRRSPRAAE
jgi:hypothetical protein